MTQLTLLQTEEAKGGGCACCAAPSADIETTVTSSNAIAATTEEAAMSENAVVAEYTVTGMTCGHCVASVTEEVGALSGVSDVAVDLATGKVTVTSAAPLEVAAVEAAVDEAGYQLVG